MEKWLVLSLIINLVLWYKWNQAKRYKEMYASLFNKETNDKRLPDAYSGKLNEGRIKAYKQIAEGYNIEEGTVRDIFSKGIDWYKSLLKKTKYELQNENV